MNLLDLSQKVNEDVQSYVSKTSYNFERGSSNYDYEQLLIKLEQDIRSHIKTEFQLKIYCDSLESRLDSLEKMGGFQEHEEGNRKDFSNIISQKKILDLKEVSPT